jgi:PAS domain S-box-containing protein
VLHSLLERQLRKNGLRAEVPPTTGEAWAQFLERVSRTYTEADQDRYTTERSLEISSAEMQALHAALAEERDHLRAVLAQERQAAAEKETIATVSRLFLRSDSLESIWVELPRILSEQFGFATGTIELCDPVACATAPAGAPRSPDGETAGRALPFEETISGRVARSGEPIFESDVLSRPDPDLAPLRALGIRAFACVPARIGGRVVATLSLADPAAREIDPSLRHTLQILANYLAQAIERKRAEEAVREAEERFRRIVESALDAVITIDSAGSVRDWNPQAESMFGWKREEALGRILAELVIPPSYRAAQSEGMRRFLETGEGPVLNRRMELTAVRRGGTEFPVELAVAAVRQAGTWLFSAFVRDITERRRAEESLRLAKEAAEAASHAKSEFLANMSHEIRTPLNGVMGILDLLLDDSLPPQAREYVAIARQSAEALLRVLGDVLDFSKIEAGKMDLEWADFDLRELLEGVGDLLAARAQEKGLELVCGLAPNGPARARGDAARLRQVLLNLAGNAVKFTDRGEVVLLGETESRPDGRVEIRFVVRDTGIGIPEERRTRLFQPFSQGDSSLTRRHGGTGLGLAISRRLVELMGGTIELSAAPGAGSTFLVRLLLDAAAGPAPSPLARLVGRRVLVVDDPPSTRDFLTVQLRAAGADAAAASTGVEATRLVREARAAGRPFDAVVLDRHLATEDGLLLADGVRQESGSSPPHLFLLLPLRARQEGISGRFDGFLTKPVKASLLVSALADVPPAASNDLRGKRETARGAGLRVLLVEDDPVNRIVATALLRRMGIEPAVASNGKDAVEAFAGQPLDLVLMDVQMPVLDGLEATAAIRALEGGERHVPIVALTAHATKEDRDRSLAAGMDDYLTKPIRADDLARAVERWTGAAARS